MKVRKFKLYILLLAVVKFLFALIVIWNNELDFGSFLIGWDELQWQDGSLYFYENGLGVRAISLVTGLPGSFTNAGWPYLVGIIHHIFGISYYNAILLKFLLFFFAASSLFKLLLQIDQNKKKAIICVLFLAIYHPITALDATFMRDDILVYLVIILLRLSAVKGFFRGLLALIVFLFLGYILFMSRPFALLVFLSLYLFYFKLARAFHLLFLLPIVGGVIVLDPHVIGYSFRFVSAFQINVASIFFQALKYYFGPLPWQMIGVDSGYNPIWYFLTLSLIMVGFFVRQFYEECLKNWKIIIALFITGAFPYIISSASVDAVGPRQFAMIGPFLFIILYANIISKLRFR